MEMLPMRFRAAGRLGAAATLAATLLAGSGAAAAEKRIGIVLFSSEARYVEAVRGIRERLAAAGYGPEAIVEENAEANKAKGAELVKKLAAARLDLIFSLGTSVTVPLAREIRDVPIVFAIVYDPVESGIARTWVSSGNNTTGTSTRIPMGLVLDRLGDLATIRSLAVLYTPGERNSELQLRDLQEAVGKRDLRILPVPLTRQEEVEAVIPEVIRASDALYLTGSNLVNSQLGRILDLASRSRTITATHLEDLVEKGVLFGVCASSYKLGAMAGDKGLQILKGARPASIPIDTIDNLDLIVNRRTATKLGIPLPATMVRSAGRIIE